MPWTLELVDDGKVLRLAFSGVLSPESSVGMTDAALAKILETGVKCVLIDFAHAQLEIPITQIYRLPDRYDAAGVPRSTRVAVLIPKDQYKRELFEFYEDVCRNRGYFVRLFEDEAAAWEWLRKSEAG